MVNGADDPLTGVTRTTGWLDASATSEGVFEAAGEAGASKTSSSAQTPLLRPCLPQLEHVLVFAERASEAGAYGDVMTRRFPMPSFPVGWFQVAYSEDLDVGAVVPLHYFGQHLVLFRGEDQLGLLDAYCPHLGAHLGHGGREGNSVVCPFHAWKI